MLGRANGNGCGDHPAGIIGTGYRLHRAHARFCVGDRVDVREAARKMIMLRLLSLLSPSFFLERDRQARPFFLFREREGKPLRHTINTPTRSFSSQS